jgi:hypothetical protein
MSVYRESYGSQPEPVYIFDPQEDITAYEIAQLLPVFVYAWRNALNVNEIKGRVIPFTDIEGLSESLRRHFHKP